MIRLYRNFKESETAVLQITGRTVDHLSARTISLDKATKHLSTDKEDRLQIFSFLCMNFECVHGRLELTQATPNIIYQSLPIT